MKNKCKEIVLALLLILGIAWGIWFLLRERTIEIVPVASAQTITEPKMRNDVADNFVRDYVMAEARKMGVNPVIADFIISHESQYQDRDGDDGQSRSWWQISKIYHPEVSDKCAHSLQCSTKWALHRIKDGFAREWSVFRFRCKWFKNAPNC